MDDIESLLIFFRDYMPEFQISKEKLLCPTPELVFRFYDNFISEFHEGVTFLVGSSMNILDTDSDSMDPEERLLQKMTQMCEVFQAAGMRLLHGDIYDPTPVRTKNLFKICMHFSSYTEKLLDDTEGLSNHIRKMKDDTLKMKEEQQQLVSSINDTTKEKCMLLENSEKLTSELKILTGLQEEYEELKMKKNKVKCDKRKQIEIMKRELQQEEYHLEQVEIQEKIHTEQTITKDEHISLLQMLDDLENEVKCLGNDDVDMADILVHENDMLQHCQDCRKKIPDVAEFDIELVKNLGRDEELLNDLEVRLNKLTTKLETSRQSKNQLEKLLKEAEYLFSKDQLERETNQMFFLKKLDELLPRLTHSKLEMEVRLQNTHKNIALYEHNINELKSVRDKIRKCFVDEYIRFCKAEKSVVDKFDEYLETVGNKR